MNSRMTAVEKKFLNLCCFGTIDDNDHEMIYEKENWWFYGGCLSNLRDDDISIKDFIKKDPEYIVNKLINSIETDNIDSNLIYKLIPTIPNMIEIVKTLMDVEIFDINGIFEYYYSYSLLDYACDKNNVDLIIKIIENPKFDISYSRASLHLACENSNYDIFQFLLSMPKIPVFDGRLFTAIFDTGDWKIFSLIMEKYDVNPLDKYDVNLVEDINMTSREKVNICKIDKNIDINYKPTLLNKAFEKKRLNMIKFMWKHPKVQSKILDRDFFQEFITSACVSCKSGYFCTKCDKCFDVIRFILDNIINYHEKNRRYLISYLFMKICHYGIYNAFCFLYETYFDDIDINFRQNGYTCLLSICVSEQYTAYWRDILGVFPPENNEYCDVILSMITQIIAHPDIDINVRSPFGQTALEMAHGSEKLNSIIELFKTHSNIDLTCLEKCN